MNLFIEKLAGFLYSNHEGKNKPIVNEMYDDFLVEIPYVLNAKSFIENNKGILLCPIKSIFPELDTSSVKKTKGLLFNPCVELEKLKNNHSFYKPLPLSRLLCDEPLNIYPIFPIKNCSHKYVLFISGSEVSQKEIFENRLFRDYSYYRKILKGLEEDLKKSNNEIILNKKK